MTEDQCLIQLNVILQPVNYCQKGQPGTFDRFFARYCSEGGYSNGKSFRRRYKMHNHWPWRNQYVSRQN